MTQQSRPKFVAHSPLAPVTRSECRLWVKSAGLMPRRPLPVCPNQRTSPDRPDWAASCQKATSVRPPAQGLKSCIRCGHLLNERLKSNDDFGCSLTVSSDKIEHLPDFFQIWRFSAQPV